MRCGGKEKKKWNCILHFCIFNGEEKKQKYFFKHSFSFFIRNTLLNNFFFFHLLIILYFNKISSKFDFTLQNIFVTRASTIRSSYHISHYTQYIERKKYTRHLYRVSNIPFFFAPIIIFVSYPIKIECKLESIKYMRAVLTIIYSSFVNLKKLIDSKLKDKKKRSPNLNKNSRINQI